MRVDVSMPDDWVWTGLPLWGLVWMPAKLLLNGLSQAMCRLASCCFESTEVEVERDPQTGVVSLRPLRSSLLEWLRRRAALLDQEQCSTDDFAVLTQRCCFHGLTAAAQA